MPSCSLCRHSNVYFRHLLFGNETMYIYIYIYIFGLYLYSAKVVTFRLVHFVFDVYTSNINNMLIYNMIMEASWRCGFLVTFFHCSEICLCQRCDIITKPQTRAAHVDLKEDETDTEHYFDVIKGLVATQITSLTIVYSSVYSDADQRKHQSSTSLAFVWGIHRGPVNSPHKWPVTRKMFPFDDVIMGHIMTSSNGNIFRTTVSLCGESTWRSPADSLTMGQ